MAYVNDPNAPQFFSGDVCRAAEIDAATLKNWISREPPAIIMSDADRKAESAGRPHLFTFRRVMQVALTAELVKLGVPPRRAGMIALGFTDVGHGSTGWAGEKPSDQGRHPGEHFAKGNTYLVATADDLASDQGFGHCFNELPGTSLGDAMKDRFRRSVAGAIILDVGEIEFMVRARLGLPRDVVRTGGAANSQDEGR